MNETTLQVPSGCAIDDPQSRLETILREEWPYYDAIVDNDPNRIVALDVLAPVSVNAYAFRGGAGNLRRIHAGLAMACDELLPGIPIDADLADVGVDLSQPRELLHAAVAVDGVLVPVATKVLFRKRRALIPMLDNVLLGYYLDALGQATRRWRTQDAQSAADVAISVMRAFRSDLIACRDRLSRLVDHAQAIGRPVGQVRVLEVLIWSQVEPRGYYRA